MPIPDEIRDRLARARAELKSARKNSAQRRSTERKRERGDREREAQAQKEATRRAREIWNWLDADGQSLAAELRRNGIPWLTLVDDPHSGYRGTIILHVDGTLTMCRRTGPAWGDQGRVWSPEDMAARCRPVVVLELAHAITDGSIWDRVRNQLDKVGRRARRIAEDELDELEELD